MNSNNINVVKIFPTTKVEMGPAEELEALAARYRAGELAGMNVTYVTTDGEVEFKLFGVAADDPEISIGLVDRLKRRLERLFFGVAR